MKGDPSRYSERKGIFKESPHKNIIDRINQDDDGIYRIAAKLRFLEDDINSIIHHNKEIAAENKCLFKRQREI